jgi:hypothetical protein
MSLFPPRYTQANADYWAASHNVVKAVWLPDSARRAGKFVVDARRADCEAHSVGELVSLGWIDYFRKFQDHTGLGPVLNYLGFAAAVSKAPGRGDPLHTKGEVTFAPMPEIIDRVSDLNRNLPAAHRLPQLELRRGGVIPGQDYLEARAEDVVLVADGTGGGRNALTAAHDLVFHLPPKLAFDPASRQPFKKLAAMTLALPHDTPGDYPGETLIDTVARKYDSFESPHYLSANHVAASDGASGYTMKHEQATGTRRALTDLNTFAGSHDFPGWAALSSETPEDLGAQCVAHVAYLGRHMLSLQQ